VYTTHYLNTFGKVHRVTVLGIITYDAKRITYMHTFDACNDKHNMLYCLRMSDVTYIRYDNRKGVSTCRTCIKYSGTRYTTYLKQYILNLPVIKFLDYIITYVLHVSLYVCFVYHFTCNIHTI
jgi:hypothetical protein